MSNFLKITVFATAVYFLSWIFVYSVGVNDLPIQSEDALPAIFLPVTIVKKGTLYADEYYNMIIEKYPHPDDKDYQLGLTPFYFSKVDDSYISAFPLMTGFLALPIYILPLLMGVSITWQSLAILAHLAAAIIVSISGGFLYILLRDHLVKNEKGSIFLTVIYLFGTINYALISQSLWQHGTLQLFLILSLLSLYNKRWFLTGLFLGFSVLSRPTAIVMVPFLLLIWISKVFDPEQDIKKIKLDGHSIRSLLLLVFGLSLTIIFFFWYTKRYYLGIENNGYADQLLVGWLSEFPEGFLGLWLSPSKGILVYSPIFIFSITSFVKLLKTGKWKEKENFIYVTSAAIVVTHILILGIWKHWYGGWSFGYRMAADVIPFLIILLIPAVKGMPALKYKKLFVALAVLSILIEIYGMIFFDGVWHAAYDDGFENTAWLWSIKDSEFVFNFRRVLVKFDLMEKACPKC